MKRFATYLYKDTKYKLLGFTRNNSLIPTRVWVETLQGKRIEIDRIKFESEAEYLFYKVPKKPKNRKYRSVGMARKVDIYKGNELVGQVQTINDAISYVDSNYSAVYKSLTEGTEINGYICKYKQEAKYMLYKNKEVIGTADTIKEACKILKCSRQTLSQLISGKTIKGKSLTRG